MTPQEIAAKIAGARVTGGGNWIKQGRGVLIARKLIQGEEPRFYNGATFVAEMLVESSSSIPGAEEEANAPGTTVSFVQNFKSKPDTAFSNTKAFLMALLNETDESLAADAADEAKKMKEAGTLPAGGWGPEMQFAKAILAVTNEVTNPCCGMRVAYETYRKPAVKSKMMLTLVRWSPVIGQTSETIAQGRALALGQK